MSSILNKNDPYMREAIENLNARGKVKPAPIKRKASRVESKTDFITPTIYLSGVFTGIALSLLS